MKRSSNRISLAGCLAACLAFALAPESRAETGITNIINGVTTNIPTYTVGNTGPFNALIVTNGGQGIAESDVFIGYSAGANSNLVIVTGVGSALNINNGGTGVGAIGSVGNRLTIANSGRVVDTVGIIGWQSGANGNSVLVTDAGSVWSNSSFIKVGASGAGNSLTITNGGKAFNTIGYIGTEVGSSNNSVLVTGAGSVWNNSSDLYVGYFGAGNSLTITNSGKVFDSIGYIGYNAGATGNSVVVTGAGSMWSNSESLYVGTSGSSNSLTISNGARVFSGNGEIGYYNSSSNNTVLVTGAGSAWVNTNILRVGRGGSGNSLTIADGGRVSDVTGYVDVTFGGNNNSALVTGAGSVWTNSGDLFVGYTGYGNSLTISNGAQVFSASGEIGYNSTSSNNTVLVTGAGSAWVNTNILRVGHGGSGNSLIIANGGWVSDSMGFVDGIVAGNNNAALVTGTGSTWSNSNNFVVGNAGYGNSLIVTNGGRVLSANGYIGYDNTASNNWALVSGVGSVWSNSGTLIVGYRGSNNRLTINDGGRVFSATGYVDDIEAGNNNAVVVSGAGSLWSNSSALIVGNNGNGNSLTVTNTGIAAAPSVVIGAGSGTGNSVNVSGGYIYATNGSSTGSFDARNGTLNLNSGLLLADLFYASNGPSSAVNFSGGTLSVGAATVANGSPFYVGDGTSAAAMLLRRSGSSFSSDLVVRNNAMLTVYGSVNVGGNYSQSSGGTLMVEFTGSAGEYSSGYLNIAGAASLGGMVAAAGYNGFAPTNGLQITFLHAAGGWTNSFSGFTNLTALAASLIYPTASDVAVKWSQTAFEPRGLTPHQSSVGRALDVDVNNPNMAPLINFLNTLPVGQLPGVFETLSGQGLTPMPLLELGTANVQAGNIMSRFGTLQTAGGGGGFSGGLSLFDPTGMMDWIDRQPRFASMLPSQLELAMSRDALTSGILRRTSDNPWGVFVEGAGQFVGVDSVPTASGYHVTTAGLTVGIDRQVMDATTYPHDQMVVGFALGYANASSYLSGDGRVNINGVQGTAYSTWFHDGWHVEAAAGGGVNLYDTKRVVFGQDARGNTQGTDIQGLLGGGYDWRNGAWTFGPRATVQYTKVDIDGFTESGSLAPLTLSSQSMNSLVTQLGAHLARAIEVGKTVWTPELRLGWQHESMDSSTAVDAQFANGSGNIFNSRGVPLGRDAAVVGAGLSVQWSKDLTTYINYDTELMRNNYSVHSVNAGIRFSF